MENPRNFRKQQLNHYGFTPISYALANGLALSVFGLAMLGLENQGVPPVFAAIPAAASGYFYADYAKGFFQEGHGIIKSNQAYVDRYAQGQRPTLSAGQKVTAGVINTLFGAGLGFIAAWQVYHGLDALPFVDNQAKDIISLGFGLVPPIAAARTSFTTRRLS